MSNTSPSSARSPGLSRPQTARTSQHNNAILYNTRHTLKIENTNHQATKPVIPVRTNSSSIPCPYPIRPSIPISMPPYRFISVPIPKRKKRPTTFCVACSPIAKSKKRDKSCLLTRRFNSLATRKQTRNTKRPTPDQLRPPNAFHHKI